MTTISRLGEWRKCSQCEAPAIADVGRWHEGHPDYEPTLPFCYACMCKYRPDSAVGFHGNLPSRLCVIK
jgi:hypothetical protein